MRAYLDLLEKVYMEGLDRTGRTKTGTRSLFGDQLRFDLTQGFPLVTTKKVHLKAIIYELLWFLSGDTNVKYLQENKVRIWNDWANEKGDLGRIYGAQWRSWKTSDGKSIDQMVQVVESLKTDPYSRRHLVVAFNPGELQEMALPPCHAFFQFYVGKGTLSCQLYQRSADMFLGVPFNIASYSLLTMMVAQVCGLKPKEFIHTFGDIHIYHNHFQQVQLQLKRIPKPLPHMWINPEAKDLFAFKFEDFELRDYDCHPLIRGEVSV